MGFKYVEGMEKPLPDYAERLKKRTGTSEALVKGKNSSGKLTEEQALELNK